MTHSASESSPAHWSRTAIASSIFALAGFFTVGILLGLFLAAIGAVCGHVARYDVAENGLRGRRLATTGLVVSYLALFSFPFWMGIAVGTMPALSWFEEGRDASQRQESLAKVESLYSVCEDFARANSGRYPKEWNQLAGQYLPSHELRRLLKSPYENGGSQSFEMVPHDRPVLAAIADSVIVIQEIAPSTESHIAVVFANGTVKSIHNPDFGSR